MVRWIDMSSLLLQVHRQVLGFLGFGNLIWKCGHFAIIITIANIFWSTLLDLIESLQLLYYPHLIDEESENK